MNRWISQSQYVITYIIIWLVRINMDRWIVVGENKYEPLDFPPTTSTYLSHKLPIYPSHLPRDYIFTPLTYLSILPINTSSHSFIKIIHNHPQPSKKPSKYKPLQEEESYTLSFTQNIIYFNEVFVILILYL